MQSIYALHQKSSDDIEKEEKFLLHSIDSIQDLYLIMLSSLIEIRKKEIVFLEASSKKHLATTEEKNPNRKAYFPFDILEWDSKDFGVGFFAVIAASPLWLSGI
jgi:hypothetical protein